MKELTPFSSFTDEELLQRVYISDNVPPIALELAARLQHALDELRKPPSDLESIFDKYGRSSPDGSDA